MPIKTSNIPGEKSAAALCGEKGTESGSHHVSPGGQEGGIHSSLRFLSGTATASP